MKATRFTLLCAAGLLAAPLQSRAEGAPETPAAAPAAPAPTPAPAPAEKADAPAAAPQTPAAAPAPAPAAPAPTPAPAPVTPPPAASTPEAPTPSAPAPAAASPAPAPSAPAPSAPAPSVQSVSSAPAPEPKQPEAPKPAAEAAPAPAAAEPAAPKQAEAPKPAEAPRSALGLKEPTLRLPTVLPPLDVILNKDIVETFRTLPVQDSGRIKPLDTVARFRLLRYFYRQSIALTDTGMTSAGLGQAAPKPLTDPATGKPILDAKGKPMQLSAIEWLLVTWFRPDIAKDLPVFCVDDSDAVVALGLKPKSKRDRYSRNEIYPALDTLLKKMEEISKVNAKERSDVERDVAKLGSDFLDNEMILSHFNFARPELLLNKALPAEITQPPAGERPGIVGFLTRLVAYFKAHPEAAAPVANPWYQDLNRELNKAFMGAVMSGNEGQAFRIFPPKDWHVETWNSPGSLMKAMLNREASSDPGLEANLPLLTAWENVYLSAADPAQFGPTLKAFHDDMLKRSAERLAAAQAEYAKVNQQLAEAEHHNDSAALINLKSEEKSLGNEVKSNTHHVATEVWYYKTDFFTNALVYFLIALVVLAVSWASPFSLFGRICVGLSWIAMLVGETYGVTGIVTRCIIMDRPPVTNLYETIIFIATAGVLFALIAELVIPRRIALTVAAIAGLAGMFLSIRFMDMEATDNMQQLEAVLITNFWLATHVVCVNLGYAANMVAAILSMVYFGSRITRVAKAGDSLARDLHRVGYGFVMAGLFLSLVGTVLGGIWANYSWGRFWGWDPKENGALMIVIMDLVILHARLGGFIKEVGFHAMNLILGMIVVFSWFGVNQLGVGLHSYGATAGMWKWLYIFWSIQLCILAYAVFLAFWDRAQRRAKKAHAHEEEKPGVPVTA